MGHTAQGWATHGGAEGQREGPAGDSSAPPFRTQLERRKGGGKSKTHRERDRKRERAGEGHREQMVTHRGERNTQ